MWQTISATVVSRLAALPLDPIVKVLEALLANHRAFEYAKEALRDEYSSAVYPASYDHVVNNFQIGKQDVLDYFREASPPTAAGLRQHLEGRLVSRAEAWIENRPSDDLVRRMISDFYRAYEGYFITSDPMLSSLHLTGIAFDATAVLAEIREALATMKAAPPQPRSRGATISHRITQALRVAGVPFDVIEQSETYLDLHVVDPASLVPLSIYVSAYEAPVGQDDIERLVGRVAAGADASHVVAVCGATPTPDLRAFASRRRIRLMDAQEFRELLLVRRTSSDLIIGSLAADSLVRALNIHEFYVTPDLVRTVPADRMEERYFTERLPADEVVHEFISDSTSSMLVVLGDYGSGKSALAAHTLSLLSDPDGPCVAALIPLGRLESAEELANATEEADRALQALFPRGERRLVILDGLDELPNAMSPNDKKLNMLRALEASARTDKVIVTARTSYFRGLDDFWDLFARSGDEALWTRLAAHIPESRGRPTVEAVILREFDTVKIHQYVRHALQRGGNDEVSEESFFDELREKDPDDVYVKLMRNPLYAFLIVNTRPWADPTVRCLGDVVRLFIRYWLERDVAKGPSRWLLSTSDRLEFIEALAWRMFREERTTLSFDDFDRIVRDHFAVESDTDTGALALDLQTTGVLAAVGRTLFFALPSYANYFVAERFREGFRREWPQRLPNLGQAKLWLGLFETRGQELDYWSPPEGWAEQVGVDFEADVPIEVARYGVLYDSRAHQDFSVNGPRVARARAVLRASLEGTGRGDEIPGIRVALRITNRAGLHARPAAKFVSALCQTVPRSDSEPTPLVTAVYGGLQVDAQDIVGMLILCVTTGGVMDLWFREATQAQIEDFLGKLNARVADDGSDIWTTDFNEHSLGRGGVEYRL